ncbi:hypothetical protein O77CONTIG1_01238 [Leptolyngbya sp. O-77]|nr:hypothetical protein O77CONTIG1_01238 [Leptolyngbya sp. O-77]
MKHEELADIIVKTLNVFDFLRAMFICGVR